MVDTSFIQHVITSSWNHLTNYFSDRCTHNAALKFHYFFLCPDGECSHVRSHRKQTSHARSTQAGRHAGRQTTRGAAAQERDPDTVRRRGRTNCTVVV